MTIRRKFFPSRPVQTELGRSVELTVQLHRGAAPAPAPCLIHGAHWSITIPSGDMEEFWRLLIEEEEEEEEVEEGDWEVDGIGNGSIGRFLAHYRGKPHLHTYTDQSGETRQQKLEAPHFHCHRLEIDRNDWWPGYLGADAVCPPVLLGTLLGSHMTDAHWTVTWEPAHPADSGKSATGDFYLTAGNALWVYPVFREEEEEEEERIDTHLQATAWCGGKAVAQLELIIRA